MSDEFDPTLDGDEETTDAEGVALPDDIEEEELDVPPELLKDEPEDGM